MRTAGRTILRRRQNERNITRDRQMQCELTEWKREDERERKRINERKQKDRKERNRGGGMVFRDPC